MPADHQPASDSLPDLRPTPADAPADPDSPRLSSPNSGWADTPPQPDTSQDALLAQKLQDDDTAAAAAPPLVGEPVLAAAAPAGGPARLAEDDTWHDVSFLALFVCGFGGFVACCGLVLQEHGINFPKDMKVNSDRDVACWVALLCTAAAVSGSLAGIAMWLLKRWPLHMTYVMVSIQVGLLAALTFVMLALGQLYSAMLLLLLSLLLGLWAYLVRDMMPFAAALISIAGCVMTEHPSTIGLSLASLVPQTGLLVLALLAVLSISSSLDDGHDHGMSGQVVFIAFGWFWSSQVIRNVVHMSCAGVTVVWYFGIRVVSPLMHGFCRATTKSFGSICLGSLLVAVVQTMRFMVNMQRENAPFLASCLDCLLSCVENVLKMMNKFAFTYIAIYSSSFCDAASNVWDLLKERGFDLVINNDITETVFMMAAICVALLTALIVGLAAVVAKVGGALLLTFAAGVIGFVVCSLTLAPLDSSVATLFVCFAEDPAQLNATSPALNGQLHQAWAQGLGEEDWSVRMHTTRYAAAPVHTAYPVP